MKWQKQQKNYFILVHGFYYQERFFCKLKKLIINYCYLLPKTFYVSIILKFQQILFCRPKLL